eukprot:TRINITY_DN109723_c0_g1_i1.p1 TRINITY_DN109723_c0_g1~~TRINITY_DN109723_c0_g1_i1.p1  ORF type:complete len:628 (-),score=93.82 TRINITY_DN109723_c0_g1_i1:171-2054(-)
MGCTSSCSEASGDDKFDADVTDVTHRALSSEVDQDVRSGARKRTLTSASVNSSVDGDKDQLAWVNHGLQHLWPQLDQLARFIAEHKILPSIIETVKKSDKVKDVKFSRFNLGSHPVVLGPVQTSNESNSSVRLRVYVDYESDMEVELELETIVGQVFCGMKDFSISGQAVMLLRPFIANAPGTGGVSMFFINPPEVNFGLLGVARLAEFPGMKDLLQGAVMKVLCDKLVLPNTMSITMGYEDFKLYPISIQQPVPVGILEVTFIKVSDAPTKRQSRLQAGRVGDKKPSGRASVVSALSSFGTRLLKSVHAAAEAADTQLARMYGKELKDYLTFSVGDHEVPVELDEEQKTFLFLAHDPEQMLHICLWDRDFTSADDKIGEACIQSMREALALSGKEITLSSVSYEDEISTAVIMETRWHSRRNGALKNGSKCVVAARVRELQQPGLKLKGRKIAIRMRLGTLPFDLEKRDTYEENRMPPGTVMKGVDDNPAVVPVLAKIRDNMTKAGLEKSVEAAMDLSDIAKTRISFNRPLSFVASIDDALRSKSLEMTLLELKELSQDKKDIQEVSVGQKVIPMSEVLDAEGGMLPGPFKFSGELGEIDALISVRVMGFGSASEVDINNMETEDF